MYKLAYARAFGIPVPAVDEAGRSVGKVLELMLGYGGGVAAFITGAATYRVDLEQMAEACWPAVPEDVKIEAGKFWFWAQEQERTYGLPEHVFCACEALKRLWRRENPAIVQLWADYETAAIIATQDEEATEVGPVVFDRQGNWLRIRLPSGRFLCYPSPRVEAGKLSFLGHNTYTKSWGRQGTWGGTLVENVTQAFARDVLTVGLLRAEAEGLNPILHVHDEIVCEVPEALDIAPAELVECMTAEIEWAPGLPLAAKGFECTRYRKE